MPTAKTSSFHHLDADSSFSGALKKYQADSDVEALNDACFLHQSHEKETKGFWAAIQALGDALASFNIAPSNSYNRHMAAVRHGSDIEAIGADWEMVGEDLSHALIRHILTEKGTMAEGRKKGGKTSD